MTLTLISANKIYAAPSKMDKFVNKCPEESSISVVNPVITDHDFSYIQNFRHFKLHVVNVHTVFMQASALRLEQEVKERETELEQAYTRLQEGEPPTQDAEQNWNRIMKTQALRKQEEEMRRAVSEGREWGERENLVFLLFIKANILFDMANINFFYLI